ncbi:MAG: ABC transporter permease [Bacillus sp. (in: Bacteria)]|nr:ABC transporter permease [Bacillus sp. (in: firmicutes)]
MNKFWVMLSHVFMTRVKSKPFIISTILVAAAIVLLANMDAIMNSFSDEDRVDHVAVIDETGEQVFFLLEEQIELFHEDIAVELSNDSFDRLVGQVEEGEYVGLLVIKDGETGVMEAVYHSTSLTPSRVSFALSSALQGVQSSVVTSRLQLSLEEIALLTAPVDFSQASVVEGARTQEEMNQARGIVYVLLFFIYFSVIFYSSIIATEVATEKSSRVMEILISSISPVKQMFAKIIGVGMAGLAQLTFFLIIGYFTISRMQEELVGDFFEFFGFEDLAVSTIVYAIVFFFLGYFLYATLAALLGSLVSRTEDVQFTILPMMFLVIAGFMIAMFGLNHPEATFITITSYIPFFTPMVMFLRVGMLNVPFVEPLIGILLLLLAIFLLAWFGARVYRGGVLMYGTSSSFKDIKRALELGKKIVFFRIKKKDVCTY